MARTSSGFFDSDLGYGLGILLFEKMKLFPSELKARGITWTDIEAASAFYTVLAEKAPKEMP